MAKRVGRRAVDLRRVLAGERAAAVVCGAAVGVDDDLPAGQAAVADRPADHEASGRVDQEPRIRAEHVGRDHGLDDLLYDGLLDVLVPDLLAVLGRQHDGVDRHRPTAFIADRDLGLGIGPKPLEGARLADLRLPFHQPVRAGDRKGHQHVGFVAGIAEHQPLVAGALVEIQALAFVDALRDIGRLPVERDPDLAAFMVESELRRIVADLPDHPSRHLRIVHVPVRRDLSRHDHQPGGHQGLAGHPRDGILLKQGIEDCIGNLVGHLVGVALRYGFRGKQIRVRHIQNTPVGRDNINPETKSIRPRWAGGPCAVWCHEQMLERGTAAS